MTTQNLIIEKKGLAGLFSWLKDKGHQVEISDKKVFDIKVDGEYAEVKTKKGSWDDFDFIGITKNQYSAMESGELRKVYLVLNANNPESIEVKILNCSDLLNAEHTMEPTYYWYKKSIREVVEKC